MAMPMNSEARPPSTISMITTTSSTAVMTLFCSSCSMMRMSFDLSCVKVTSTVSGQVAVSSSTTARVASTVSIRLAPVRFDTSMVIAGLPLMRVIEVGSLKVGRTSATSPSVTDGVAGDGDRKVQDVLGVSISAGTFTAKRPDSPSSAPAATRLLPALKDGDQLVERDAVALAAASARR